MSLFCLPRKDEFPGFGFLHFGLPKHFLAQLSGTQLPECDQKWHQGWLLDGGMLTHILTPGTTLGFVFPSVGQFYSFDKSRIWQGKPSLQLTQCEFQTLFL